MTAPPRTALIADDHVEMARLLADKLTAEGWSCRIADGGQAAIDLLAQGSPDLVVSDLRMAGVDGMDVLAAARAADPDLPVIIMTAFGNIDTAIDAIRHGAWHYLVKPVRLEELVLHATRALEQSALRRENRQLRVQAREGLEALVGRSPIMRDLYALVDRVALSSAAVLLRGESGTGKELVARAIHTAGPRRDGPFLAINCTALPESLLESELFGHTRGAFTGASAARSGLFVEASGGTLFLDEIGDMPLGLQAKLLRVAQQGEVRPLGSDETRHVDVRIVAATHQDLEHRITDGSFRADLFHRLNVVPIYVPALRERIPDIPLLVEHFFARSRTRNAHSPAREIDPSILPVLAAYSWPGNVRELENLIERLVVVGATARIGLPELTTAAPAIVNREQRFSLQRDRLATLREVEEEYIAWVLERCNGNKTKAAESLGIDPSTLHRRIRR